MQTAEWKEVRLFISSTFNDMHAERDYLVTEVFPELKEWCEARRIRLTDIDLRWGVTSDDAETESTVSTCLRCIDECRPFFLCFLGQRRGWVPDPGSVAADEAVSEYAGLKERIGRSSITEIEIEHAVLAPMAHLLSDGNKAPEKCRAFFYFRENPFSGSGGILKWFSRGKASGSSPLTEEQRRIYTNAGTADEEAEDRKLEETKQRIRKEWQTRQYTCRWAPDLVTEELRGLGEVCRGRLTDFACKRKPLRESVLDDLKEAIGQEFPDRQPVSAGDEYEEDILEQHLFAQTACLDFAGRRDELDRVMQYTGTCSNEEPKVLFVTGEEGYGKTALLSKAWLQQRAAGGKMIYRSCGATDKSLSEDELNLSIGDEAGLFRASEQKQADKDRPPVRRITKEYLANLLAHGVSGLILDGLERLPSHGGLLHVSGIPAGFSLVVSSDRAEDAGRLGFSCDTLVLQPVSREEDRQELVEAFLKRTLKRLDREQMKLLVSAPGAAVPLFLKTVCSELRTFGSWSGLTEKIRRFGTTLEDAFAEVLRTVEGERDGNDTLFPAVAALFAFSRGGLDNAELSRALVLLGFSGGDIPYQTGMILRRLSSYLSRTNRRYELMIPGLRKAIRLRYANIEASCRKALAEIYRENLMKAPDPAPNTGVTEVHGSRELLYQLAMLGDRDGLLQAVKDKSLFSKIPADAYCAEYKNGSFFVWDSNDDLGLSDENSGKAVECNLMLAGVILEKAHEHIAEIGQKYPHPYARWGKDLRAKKDQTEFLHYRDLFYETPEYAAAAMRLAINGMKAAGSRKELDRAEAGFRRLCSTDKGVFSFMSFLSLTGSSATGLSGKLEDLADGALLAKERAEKYPAIRATEIKD